MQSVWSSTYSILDIGCAREGEVSGMSGDVWGGLVVTGVGVSDVWVWLAHGARCGESPRRMYE